MNLLNAIGNPIMKLLLRSPLHGLISGGVMLITVTGRKSGKLYTTPVTYVRDGDTITVFSYLDRTWWRNLRGGAPVTVRVKGRDLKGTGQAVADREAVSAGLVAYLQKVPRHAKYYGVSLDPEGQPNAEDAARAAQNRVMIRIQLA